MNKRLYENATKDSKRKDLQTTTSETLSSSATIEVLNILGSKRADSYRLSPAAKRLLVIRKLKEDMSARDLALLIRVLNEIDAAEDKANGGVSGTMSFGWIDSSASDVEDAEAKIDRK